MVAVEHSINAAVASLQALAADAGAGADELGRCSFTDAVLLRHFRHGRLVRLAQDFDHLLFRKSSLLHGILASRRTIVAKSQLDRKSTLRSERLVVRGEGCSQY